MGSRPLRPNVTPVKPPPIGVGPLILVAIASIPWWIGAWQIVQWILS